MRSIFLEEIGKEIPVITKDEIEANKLEEGSFENNRETISYVIFLYENRRMMALSTNSDEEVWVFPNLENQIINFPVLRDLYWNGQPSMMMES